MTEVNNDNTVAVLGLPHLAAALSDSGLNVVSGETVREAASAIQIALKAGPLPVILADAAAPMLNSWFTKVIATSPAVLVRVTSAAAPITAPGAQRVDAPVSVDAVLGMVGLPGLLPGVTLDADGEISGSAQPSHRDKTVVDDDPVDDVDDWFEAVEPVSVVSQPASTQVEDDWSDMGWDAPTQHTPAPPVSSAPAVAAEPAVPQSQPVVEEDDWSDLGWDIPEEPAQSTPAAPEPPVADAVADPMLPPAFPEYSWEAPPAPAFADVDQNAASPALADVESVQEDDWTEMWAQPEPVSPPAQPSPRPTPVAPPAPTSQTVSFGTAAPAPAAAPQPPVRRPQPPAVSQSPAPAQQPRPRTVQRPAPRPDAPRPAQPARPVPASPQPAPATVRPPVQRATPVQPQASAPQQPQAAPAQHYQRPTIQPQQQAQHPVVAPVRSAFDSGQHTSSPAVSTIGVPEGYSPTHGELAKVIAVVGAKGGVGKSSVATALATRAAAVSGKRVVLVDGNRGQGDLRVYLGLARSGLPTLYDAAVTGDVKTALLTPDRVNASRPPHMDRLDCAVILAPPQEFANAETISADLYHEVIAYARTKSDLVVIDTQIVEGAERGLFDDLFIPMMRSFAWTVGLSDLSSAGVNNLMTNMSQFAAGDVPVNRMMTMLNRVPATTDYDAESTAQALNRLGRFVAAVPVIPEVHSAMAHGTSIHDNPILAPVLDDILLAVTADPIYASASAAPAKKKGRGTPAQGPSAPRTAPDADEPKGGLLSRFRRR